MPRGKHHLRIQADTPNPRHVFFGVCHQLYGAQYHQYITAGKAVQAHSAQGTVNCASCHMERLADGVACFTSVAKRCYGLQLLFIKCFAAAMRARTRILQSINSAFAAACFPLKHSAYTHTPPPPLGGQKLRKPPQYFFSTSGC